MVPGYILLIQLCDLSTLYAVACSCTLQLYPPVYSVHQYIQPGPRTSSASIKRLGRYGLLEIDIAVRCTNREAGRIHLTMQQHIQHERCIYSIGPFYRSILFLSTQANLSQKSRLFGLCDRAVGLRDYSYTCWTATSSRGVAVCGPRRRDEVGRRCASRRPLHGTVSLLSTG